MSGLQTGTPMRSQIEIFGLCARLRGIGCKTAALCALCSVPWVPLLAGVETIKLDLSSLTQQDKEDLLLQATMFGVFEAEFEYCGLRTDIVARVTRAAEACVTREALSQVEAIFL